MTREAKMGIDVELHALGTVADAQLAEANRYMLSRGVSGYDHGDLPLDRTEWGVRWVTLSRYYGPHYERGWWPAIHNAIVCLRAALPHCEVRYGGDSDDADPPGLTLVDDAWLAGMWAHWLGPDGLAYRDRKVCRRDQGGEDGRTTKQGRRTDARRTRRRHVHRLE